jgi:hypothetical protein
VDPDPVFPDYYINHPNRIKTLYLRINLTDLTDAWINVFLLKLRVTDPDLVCFPQTLSESRSLFQSGSGSGSGFLLTIIRPNKNTINIVPTYRLVTDAWILVYLFKGKFGSGIQPCYFWFRKDSCVLERHSTMLFGFRKDSFMPHLFLYLCNLIKSLPVLLFVAGFGQVPADGLSANSSGCSV